MVATMEKTIQTEGIYLKITHTEDGDIITKDFTPFSGLSNDEIIELIETDNRLYKMERMRRKATRRSKERNKVKIALINIIRAI